MAMRARAESEELTPAAEPITTTRTLDPWRLLRFVCGLQGLYYLITGLWPLLHRFTPIRALFSATNLTGTTYPITMLLALTALIGVLLIVAAIRPRPDGSMIGLGAGTALAFFVLEWRFRGSLRRAVYVDLVVELAFALALLVIFGAAALAERRRRR